jgi:hypothetical protein
VWLGWRRRGGAKLRHSRKAPSVKAFLLITLHLPRSTGEDRNGIKREEGPGSGPEYSAFKRTIDGRKQEEADPWQPAMLLSVILSLFSFPDSFFFFF